MSLAFLVTSLIIIATPGTGAILTIAAGIRGGKRLSVVTAFGCTLGIVPHLVAAITGTAALLRLGGVAFEVLRWVGIAYLLYMAISTWRSGALALDSSAPPQSAMRTIGNAILANLLNPKLTLFFFAFLPQFVSASEPDAVPRMLELSGVFMLVTLVVFIGYGVLAAAVRSHVVSRPRVMAWIRRTVAVAFVALGARLALASRQ